MARSTKGAFLRVECSHPAQVMRHLDFVKNIISPPDQPSFESIITSYRSDHVRFCSIETKNDFEIIINHGNNVSILIAERGEISLKGQAKRPSVIVSGKTAAVLHPQTAYCVDVTSDSLLSAVFVPRRELRGQIARRAPISEAKFPMNIDLAQETSESFIQILALLREDLRSSSGLFAEPHMKYSVDELLVSSFAKVVSARLQLAHSGLVDPPEAVVWPRPVRVARRIMEGHLTEPLNVETLAQAAGTSSRTLYRLFKRFVGISPQKMFAQMRLEAIRDELLELETSNEEKRGQIARVASRYGFHNYSSFYRSYSHLFGEPPSQTMKQNDHND